MVERTSKLQVSAQIASFPSIGISMGRARAFQGISAVLGNISDELEDQLDRTAVVQAKRKGTIAGAAGFPTLTGEATLAGEAFDSAARSSLANRIELQARGKLIEFEAKNLGNPAQFNKDATGFLSGMANEIQQVDPGLAVMFKAQMGLYQQSASNRLFGQFVKIQREEQEGVIKNLFDVLSRDVGKSAGELLTVDEDRQAEIFATMEAGVKRFNVALQTIGPDGQPLTKPGKAEKLRLDFQNVLLEKTIKGWFRSLEDRTKASEELLTEKFSNKDVGTIFGLLDEKSQNRIKSELIRDESRLATIGNRQREELEAIAETQATGIERDILFGDGTLPEKKRLFEIIRNSPHLTTAKINQLDAFIRNGGRDDGVDIESNVLELERAIRNSELDSDVEIINEAMEKGGVSLKTIRTRLIPLVEARQDKEFAAALDEGQARLGYDRSAASAGLFPDRARKGLLLEARMLKFKRENEEKIKTGQPVENVFVFMEKEVAILQKSINQTAAMGLPIMVQKYRAAQLSGSAKQIASARSALVAVLVASGVVDALTASSGGFDPLAAIDQKAKEIRGQ